MILFDKMPRQHSCYGDLPKRLLLLAEIAAQGKTQSEADFIHPQGT
jgi:hypothetical protein